MPTMPSLNIDQQYAQIGIRTTNAKMQVHTPKPEMQIVNDGLPEMQVDRKTPEFTVNWKQVHAEMGLAGPVRKAKDFASKGHTKALEYANQTAKDGHYLAKVKKGENAERLAHISKRKAREAAKVETNIGPVPQNLPEIEWDPGYVNISWSNTNLQVEWDGDYLPSFTVEPHSVEIFLREQPYIKITVVEEAILSLQGRKVDENI